MDNDTDAVVTRKELADFVADGSVNIGTRRDSAAIDVVHVNEDHRNGNVHFD